MKKKLSILASGLLLAVGWTNSAQAQLLPESSATKLKARVMSLAPAVNGNFVAKQELKSDFRNMSQGELTEVTDFQSYISAAKRAPRRANYTITADATHVYNWYDSITYNWTDVNGGHTSKITEPATNPYQMAHLLGSTYMNPKLPGIKYSATYQADHPYYNIEFGWDIPANGRWNTSTETTYSDIVITSPTNTYLRIYSIKVMAGDEVLTSFCYATDGATLPYNDEEGWSWARSGTWYVEGDYIYAGSTTASITIPAVLLNGHNNVSLIVNCYDSNAQYYAFIGINGSSTRVGEDDPTDYTWAISPSGSGATSVTPPNENGYTVFLVKVKDYDISNQAPQTTSSWNDIINYFDTYIEEVDLLTDGMRVEEGTVDAGTVFTYSGILNRFYFISKGKMAYISSQSSASSYDLAPSYGMYEEFSPTSTNAGDQITDFYSKMLEGESYDVIHDCQGVNYMQHFFSMSGNTGTDAKSLTNLIFYIPDNRGVSGSRNYNEEHLPQVGLYTITLNAEAQPAANYSADNRMYDVTCTWQSSLSRILDFDVDQTYELWIFVYDEQGNPVPVPQSEGGLLYKGPNTSYTYQVPQFPESYTIIYRVKGWPTNATNNPDHNGDFYAWSNLDDVLIPGYENFLSLGLDHYESDFKIDEEHNYYRNFLTVDNQNPDNVLTANRVIAGENLFKLYRFADEDRNSIVKAAELSFTHEGNEIWYNISYFGQNYLDGYDVATLKNDYGISTRGLVATLSDGGGQTVDQYVKVTSTNDLTSGQYLIVYEGGNRAMNGGLQPFDGAGNYISVDITNSTIPATAVNNAASFNITFTNGSTATIQGASGYYMGCSTNQNGINTSETALNNTITLATNGDATIQGTVARYLKYNTSDNRFRYYGSNSQNVANVQLYKRVTSGSGSGSGSGSYTNTDLNVANFTEGFVYPDAPWSVNGTQLRLQTNGFFYILAGTGLNFTVPSGYNNASLRFVVHTGTSSYYNGTFVFTTSTGNTYTINSTAQNRDYEVTIPNVSSGDVVTITGTCLYNSTTYKYSPDFSYMNAYITGGEATSGDDALYLADIMFVDQFNAPTSTDSHPHQYSYFLQYDPEDGGDPQTSSVQDVPVQHTGATLGGYYTTAEIQGDTERQLTMNVMNADVNMTLANNPAIYYYTLDRKPSTAANNTPYEEISKLQIRTNGTYQEMDEKLTQYIGKTYDPGVAPRYDNYNVQTGNYNSYMSYVPIVWTHGDLIDNRRIKWDTEKLHNSYGAPIWKTGVGQVILHEEGTVAERQTGKFGSTNWVDENGDSCSLYILSVDAEGELPTVNSVKYVPYWFNVYAVSKKGNLRGYNWVGEGAVDSEHNGEPGSHVVNNPAQNRNIWCIYGGRTTDGVLLKTKSNTWADNIIFGALDDIDDLEIYVRFYYVVNGMDADGMMLRDGNAPAGYGAESPGFEPPMPTGIVEVWQANHGSVVSTTYVNPQGMQSSKPFDGVNIVITRYEDGTMSTSKVVR